MADAAICLGSNIGDRKSYIDRAVTLLSAFEGIRLIARSSYYSTRPWGPFQDQADFLNVCIRIDTDLGPVRLVERCRTIESWLGRGRGIHLGPRVIDLDLLYVDDLEMSTPAARVPHPRMMDRGVVLVPLAELVPDKLIRGERVADGAHRLLDEGIRRLDWPVARPNGAPLIPAGPPAQP